MFKVFDDRVECGDWLIPYAEIQTAYLYKTRQMLIPVNVLQLVTETGNYQFGFNPWATPFKHLNLAYQVRQLKLGYSPFSKVIRIVFMALLGLWVWHNWF
ncbi:hypothetical protein GCM10009092_21330 [Bowmanella denitrificans]|uniref:Uncharacterized protein n=2 Tax=Bowmanella denitrificans TaxID=366582 RepID=A0ABN0X745_9ALTE